MPKYALTRRCTHRGRFGRTSATVMLGLLLGASLGSAHAACLSHTGGKLLGTGGASQIEGTAGSGLAVWGFIAGYGASGEIGANAFATQVQTNDFRLNATGVAVGLSDRVEVSLAQQVFDTHSAGAALGLGAGFTFRQDIVGVKARVAGDAVLDQDTWLPQVALGAQYKHAARAEVLQALGATDTHGIDAYAVASKLFLAQSVLASGTVRLTRANQFGLLGFGGPRHDGYRPQLEGVVALLLRRDVAIGTEYRSKSDNLGLGENRAWDMFAAWFVNKHLSVTLAYVDLGRIVVAGTQRGLYGSIQAGF